MAVRSGCSSSNNTVVLSIAHSLEAMRPLPELRISRPIALYRPPLGPERYADRSSGSSAGPSTQEGRIELLKILGAFVGAVFGALGAVSFKEYLDRRRLRDSEQQKRWLPLLRAAQNLREKLDEFIAIYRQPTSQWRNYEYDGRPLPLEARDFHELYLLDIDAALIQTFLDLRIDPGERRKNPRRCAALERASMNCIALRFCSIGWRPISDTRSGCAKNYCTANWKAGRQRRSSCPASRQRQERAEWAHWGRHD